MRLHRWFLSWALISTVGLPLAAQSVISARSGVIHFSDGFVYLDSRRLEHHAGRFNQMNQGSELRTENGRAEVMLTPGVFLRVGEHSAIHMISNSLADTQVEFLSGSVVLDSMAGTASEPTTIVYGAYQARIQNQGCYRFNSDPPELRVENGEIEVKDGDDSATVDAGHVVPFSGKLVTRRLANETSDALDRWNSERNNSISADNAAGAGGADLSAVMDGWQNDPDALVRGLEMSGYGSALAGRTPLSTYAPLSIYPASPSYTPPLSTYNPLLNNPASGIMPYSTWGLGFGSSFGLYPSPLVRYLPYPGIGITTYRSPLMPARPGIGVSPVYSNPRPPMRPVTPAPIGGRVGHR